MASGMVFDIKKYSINDGPGIRTTVFLSGCPLKCQWCHNPESQSMQPVLMYRENRCLGCGECVETCPEEAIAFVSELEPPSSRSAPRKALNLSALRALRGKKIFTNREKCTRCQTCIATCYSGAREFSGKEVTVDEVMSQIIREIPFYDESGGGVTFSGGEPLMQPGFLSALLKACRKQEIHAVVDTSGFANWQVFEQIRGEVDLFLYDLKHMDSLRHREVTGVPNEVILENLQRLCSAGAKCVVRIPLIPGINDDKQNLVESGKFLAGLGRLEGVELMAYHDLAQAKYEALGREYALVGTRPPSEAEMSQAAELLRSYGLSVVIR
jgi:pyruvate formate lyase activating enzyme